MGMCTTSYIPFIIPQSCDSAAVMNSVNKVLTPDAAYTLDPIEPLICPFVTRVDFYFGSGTE